jgi:hypothetical protein
MIILGDINGDGKIDALDFALYVGYSLSQITFSGDAFKAADVNGDGKIDIGTQDTGEREMYIKHTWGLDMINEVINNEQE